MKDALDQLLFEVRRERRVASRERREERARNRHKIPPLEAQGKPERWKPCFTVLLVHSSGIPIGLFIELHHEVHPEWTRFQPAQSENPPHHTLVVSGSGWFSPTEVERPDSPEETIALRERFLELLNGQKAEYHPDDQVRSLDTGGSEDKDGSLFALLG